MAEWVQPEHREIHDWLTQWGQWLRSTNLQSHCASAEWQYRSPQCWQDRNPRPPEPNQAQALTIEGLMRILPKFSRKLLKLRYVYQAEANWIARRLRTKDYAGELYRARQIVLNLTRHKLAPTIHGNFSNRSLSDLQVEPSP